VVVLLLKNSIFLAKRGVFSCQTPFVLAVLAAASLFFLLGLQISAVSWCTITSVQKQNT